MASRQNVTADTMPKHERRPSGALQKQLRAAPLVIVDAGVVDGVVKPHPEFDGIAIDE
jgi:hypothetical protein